jgi:nicotinate-nucleotide adenylyltransferase
MEDRVALIVRLLEEKKAESIQTFDMRGQDYFVDEVVVATTMGERHGLALLDFLKGELKAQGEKFLNIEASSEWIVVDLGDILIHLLTPEFRAKYKLEEFLDRRNEQIKR